jgi:hypothetical protein
MAGRIGPALAVSVATEVIMISPARLDDPALIEPITTAAD